MNLCRRCNRVELPLGRKHTWCTNCLSEYQRCRMAESARDASSSDGLCASLETYVYSLDVGEDDGQDGLRDDETVLKHCMTCNAYKQMAEFCKDASRRDGKNINCKVCRNNRRKERKEVEDDAEGGENAAQDEEPPRKRSRGTTSTFSRTAASQSTRSGGRPTFRRAAMRCRSRKTSTYRR